jgi:hypothetical protein
LIAKEDPMALHRAMEDNNIRGYVKETLMLPAEDVPNITVLSKVGWLGSLLSI